MAAEQHLIVLADGPAAGEYVVVDAEPDGGLPVQVTLPDPPGLGGEPRTATTYYLVQVGQGSRQPPRYQAGR
jgi:hypothetical protein